MERLTGLSQRPPVHNLLLGRVRRPADQLPPPTHGVAGPPVGAGNSPSEMSRPSGPSPRTLAPWSSPWAFLTNRFGPTWRDCDRGASNGLVLSPTPRRIEIRNPFTVKCVVSPHAHPVQTAWLRESSAGLICKTGETESRDCWLRRVRLWHSPEINRPCVPDLGIDVQRGAGRPASPGGQDDAAPRWPRPVREEESLL